MENSYRPIDCSLHDQLEAAATLRRTIHIVYERDGEIVETADRILDIFTRDGAEFLKLSTTEVRLDELRIVDGVPFNAGC